MLLWCWYFASILNLFQWDSNWLFSINYYLSLSISLSCNHFVLHSLAIWFTSADTTENKLFQSKVNLWSTRNKKRIVCILYNQPIHPKWHFPVPLKPHNKVFLYGEILPVSKIRNKTLNEINQIIYLIKVGLHNLFTKQWNWKKWSQNLKMSWMKPLNTKCLSIKR